MNNVAGNSKGDTSGHGYTYMEHIANDLNAGLGENVGLENVNLGSKGDNGDGSKIGHDGGVDSGSVGRGRADATTGYGKQSYASFFKANRVPVEGSQLQYIAPPEGKIILELDDIDSVEETHGYCLVGYVMGPRPSPYVVLNFIKGWGEKVKFFFKDNGWIQFQFPSEVDRDRVLNGGYYMIMGCQLFLKKMPSCFLFRKEDMEFIPTWVQIFGLPKQCWTHHALSRIASVMGKPIHMDSLTKSKKGPMYARVLLEIDAKKPKISEYEVQLTTSTSTLVKFIYEYEPKYCDKCKSVGHISEMCGVSIKMRPRMQQRYRRENVPNRDPITEVSNATNNVEVNLEVIVEQQSPDLNLPMETHVHDMTEAVQQLLDVQQQACDQGKETAETYASTETGQNRENVDAEGDKSYDDFASNDFVSGGYEVDSDDLEEILSPINVKDKGESKTVQGKKTKKKKKKKSHKKVVKEITQSSGSSTWGTSAMPVGMGSGAPVQGEGSRHYKKKPGEVRPPDTASAHP